MNKYLLLLIALNFLFDITNEGVPRSSTLLQYPGFTRMLVTFQLPATAAAHPATLSANILFATPYTTAPLVIIAAREMTWIGPIAFDFTVDNITTTSCVINLNKYPTTNLANSELKDLKFCIGIFDDSIYNQTTEIFEYIEPSATVVAQSIPILHHQLYMYPILTAYQDYIDYTVHAPFNSNPSTPGYTQLQLSGALTNWQVQNTITNNGLQGYLIKRIRYTMHNVVIDNFLKMTQNYQYIENGGVGVFAGIGTLASNQFTVPAAHFYGLNVFKQLKSQATTVFFTVLTQPSINMVIKFLTMSRLYTKCPTGYPFYVLDTMLCESACPSGYFQAAQSPSVNNYFICYACDSVCAQCFGVSNNCTSCIAGQILSAMNPVTNTMTCTCSSTQYNDTFWGCIDCNSSIPYCLSCTDASTCITCQPSLIFNSTTSACECMANTTPYITTTNYVDANGIAYVYIKIRCVSKVVTQNCNDAVVTSGVGPAGTGLHPFMYGCACMTGVFVNNTCI